jgi:transcription factor SPN1
MKVLYFSNIGYDIDLYLEKKAEKRRGNRRRGGKNGDVDLAGPDSDQFVSKLIDQMKIATEEDRLFNKSRQPATAKLLLLPAVEQQVCRADLAEIFLDNGILNVLRVKQFFL